MYRKTGRTDDFSLNQYLQTENDSQIQTGSNQQILENEDHERDLEIFSIESKSSDEKMKP